MVDVRYSLCTVLDAVGAVPGVVVVVDNVVEGEERGQTRRAPRYGTLITQYSQHHVCANEDAASRLLLFQTRFILVNFDMYCLYTS